MRHLLMIGVLALVACGSSGDDDGDDAVDLTPWLQDSSGTLTIELSVTDDSAPIATQTEQVTWHASDAATITPSAKLELGVAGDLDYRKLFIDPASSSSATVEAGLFGSMFLTDPMTSDATFQVQSGSATLSGGLLSLTFDGTFFAQQGDAVADGTFHATFVTLTR